MLSFFHNPRRRNVTLTCLFRWLTFVQLVSSVASVTMSGDWPEDARDPGFYSASRPGVVLLWRRDSAQSSRGFSVPQESTRRFVALSSSCASQKTHTGKNVHPCFVYAVQSGLVNSQRMRHVMSLQRVLCHVSSVKLRRKKQHKETLWKKDRDTMHGAFGVYRARELVWWYYCPQFVLETSAHKRWIQGSQRSSSAPPPTTTTRLPHHLNFVHRSNQKNLPLPTSWFRPSKHNATKTPELFADSSDICHVSSFVKEKHRIRVCALVQNRKIERSAYSSAIDGAGVKDCLCAVTKIQVPLLIFNVLMKEKVRVRLAVVNESKLEKLQLTESSKTNDTMPHHGQ